MKQVALGEPVTVPAGQYAKEVLTSLGIYDAVNSKAVLAKDVRQVLTYVETGNVDAGIVYATDAMSSAKVKVVATAPPKSHVAGDLSGGGDQGVQESRRRAGVS